MIMMNYELWMGRCVAILNLPVPPNNGDRILTGPREYEVISRSFNRHDEQHDWTIRLYVRERG